MSIDTTLKLRYVLKYILNYSQSNKEYYSNVKLNCLLYYCQVWHFTWDSELLFEDDIYIAYSDKQIIEIKFKLEDVLSIASIKLSKSEIDSIDAVLKYYSNLVSWEIDHQVRYDLAKYTKINLIEAKSYYSSL